MARADWVWIGPDGKLELYENDSLMLFNRLIERAYLWGPHGRLVDLSKPKEPSDA